MAKDFLKRNQSILHSKKGEKKKVRRSSSIPIIVLDDEPKGSECCVKTVDLTETEPELIVLDDTVNQLNQTISNLNASLEDIDLEIIGSFNSKKRSSSKGEVEVVNVLKSKKQLFKPRNSKCSLTNSDADSVSSNVKLGRRRRKNANGSGSNLTIYLNSSGVRSVNKKRKPSTPNTDSSSQSSEIPKKKRKLQDVSNIPSTSSPKQLTGNVLKYYSKLTSAVENIKERGIESNRSKKHAFKNVQRKQRRRQLKIEMNNFNHQAESLKPLRNRIEETNIFNPNPYDVEREGLRPVVVDGSNVARGHGKGSFSVKGIEICVDYFIKRGHKTVKVFLPLHCERNFTEAKLAELRSKCDIAFTPSHLVNGVVKSSYDDRFIIQYAVEFGGVIVSTDNYRDLMKENPRWRATIETRLLMFTWVDDFLMFPVDPLGKKGPTLDEFLRF